MLKQSIRNSFRKFGVCLRGIPPKGPYGLEHMEDIRRILNGNPHLGTILDVGANKGQSAIEFNNSFPEMTIHCFEPSQSAFSSLVENTKSIPEVRCFNKALGAESCSKSFYIHDDLAMNSLLRYNYDYGKEVGEEKVSVITLDQHIAENSIESVSLLKIDTQGYDLEVLKGASGAFENGSVHLVYVETNFIDMYSNQASFEEIYLFMMKYGFKLTGLYENVYSGNNFIQWSNALFVNPSFGASHPS